MDVSVCKKGEKDMADIHFFQHMPLRKMMKMFTEPGAVTVNLKLVGEVLEISMLPYNLSQFQVGTEKVMCAFATNEKGNSCIFYDEELYGDTDGLDRVWVMKAVARYIATCQKEFLITEKTQFSQWEKTLVSELLMPRETVKEMINKLLIPSTYALSEIFQVPQSFVRERLKELKLPILIAGYNY